MILLSNIMMAIGQILGSLISFFVFVVIVQALLSWVNPDPYNQIVRFLNAATEPLLKPIRRYVPLLGGRLDISPIILLLILEALRIILVQSIVDYASIMRQSALLPG